MRHEIVEKSCEQCGKTYYAVKWSRFCPDCRKIRDAEMSRENKLRRKQKIWAETHMTEGGKALAAVNAKARAAGMTYGQYVAKHGG